MRPGAPTRLRVTGASSWFVPALVRAFALSIVGLARVAGAAAGPAVDADADATVALAVADSGADLAFAPPDDPAVRRGAEVARRFELTRRFALGWQLNNAFSAQNRTAIARAESLIAAVPGVRGVVGPAGLLALGGQAPGRLRAFPLLAGGPGEDAEEAVRQRLVRRSDAIGWFVARDGTEMRVLVDVPDLGAARARIDGAVASSGLVLLSGGAQATPLLVEPDRDPRSPPAGWALALASLAFAVPFLASAFGARPTSSRAALAALAAAVGAAAPAMLVPVARLQSGAWSLGAGAASLLLAAVLVARVAAGARARAPGGRAFGLGRTGLDGRAAVHLRAPAPIVVASLALLAAAALAWPRLTVGTRLWRASTDFFIDVRADLDEPIVLREVRRLTDFLRAEPGVAHAWSVADLFYSVPRPDSDVGGIPDTAAAVHAILAGAQDDAAVRLELGADHREALIGVRLDDDAGIDPLQVVDHVERYLALASRPSVLRVDVSDDHLPPSLRAMGRGVLAADALERILRICARSGRNLDAGEVAAIDREVRRAALIPAVDPPRLRADTTREVVRFLEEVALTERQVGLPLPAARGRLVDGLLVGADAPSVAEVSRALGELWGKSLGGAVVDARAPELRRRLQAVRRRAAAALNFRAMLYGADLPTEGVLSEEVRDATLEAMGPIASIPVPRDTPGAFRIDAVPVGGAPLDRALSAAWRPRLGAGLLLSALLTGLGLFVVGGMRGLAWWPPALAPVAPLILVPVLGATPIGTLYVAVLAGALAGGAAFAIAFAPERREP